MIWECLNKQVNYFHLLIYLFIFSLYVIESCQCHSLKQTVHCEIKLITMQYYNYKMRLSEEQRKENCF